MIFALAHMLRASRPWSAITRAVMLAPINPFEVSP